MRSEELRKFTNSNTIQPHLHRAEEVVIQSRQIDGLMDHQQYRSTGKRVVIGDDGGNSLRLDCDNALFEAGNINSTLEIIDNKGRRCR
jgi:hypothetical protein